MESENEQKYNNFTHIFKNTSPLNIHKHDIKEIKWLLVKCSVVKMKTCDYTNHRI